MGAPERRARGGRDGAFAVGELARQGIAGLRVAGCSISPTIRRASLHRTIVAVGEQLASVTSAT